MKKTELLKKLLFPKVKVLTGGAGCGKSHQLALDLKKRLTKRKNKAVLVLDGDIDFNYRGVCNETEIRKIQITSDNIKTVVKESLKEWSSQKTEFKLITFSVDRELSLKSKIEFMTELLQNLKASKNRHYYFDDNACQIFPEVLPLLEKLISNSSRLNSSFTFATQQFKAMFKCSYDLLNIDQYYVGQYAHYNDIAFTLQNKELIKSVSKYEFAVLIPKSSFSTKIKVKFDDSVGFREAAVFEEMELVNSFHGLMSNEN